MNREEFHKITAEEQIDYIVRNYPRTDKFRVRLISGHHDMQWRKDGVNILASVCERREDLVYRGDLQSDFPIRRGLNPNSRWPILKAAHHGGDNTPYAKSYPVQGFAENLVQDITDLFEKGRPDIVIVAGQGVFCDLSGGIIKRLYSVPGLRLISPSIMRKKRRSVVPQIGFIIVTIEFKDDESFTVIPDVYPLQGTKNDYREKFSSKKDITEKFSLEVQDILRLLEESPKSRGELAQAINKGDKTVIAAINTLRKAGFEIEGPDSNSAAAKSYKNYRLAPQVKSSFYTEPIKFEDYFHTTVERGVVSDTHFGHISELIAILNEAYDIFQKRGIKIVYHVGDVTNGPPKHQEHYKGEVHKFGATELTNYVIEHYPHRKGIKTFVISGDHDRWFLDIIGYNILDPISQIRKDIKYLGIQYGVREDGQVIVISEHFNWGGTTHAKSCKPQQVIESSLLKEIEQEASLYRGKIVCVLSGGGHVYCSMLYKGIIFILMPCLQGKTKFITGLGKLSDVGFVIYSITYSKDNILTKFRIEFFNRGAEALALVRQKEALKNSTLIQKPSLKPKLNPKSKK